MDLDPEIADAYEHLRWLLERHKHEYDWDVDLVKAIDALIELRVKQAVEAVYVNVQFNPTVG